MRLFLRLVDWFLFTALFLACCSTGLCVATENLINGQLPPLITSLHILIFGSTLVVYNFHYLVKRSSPVRTGLGAWAERNRPSQFVFFITGLAIAIASLRWINREIVYAGILLAVLSFTYSLPLLPFKNKKSIREFGWIKILVLDSVWTIVTTILPILYWHKPMSAYPYEIAIRFVFLFTLCVAFDLRDVQVDFNADIYTLPNLIGVKQSYRLMNITLVLFVLLSFIQYARHPVPGRLSGEIITAIATKLVINYTRRHPTDRAYFGLVDGVMFLYASLVLLRW